MMVPAYGGLLVNLLRSIIEILIMIIIMIYKTFLNYKRYKVYKTVLFISHANLEYLSLL